MKIYFSKGIPGIIGVVPPSATFNRLKLLQWARKSKLESANILYKENVTKFHTILFLYWRFLRPDWIKAGATRSDLRADPAVSRGEVCRTSPEVLMQDHPDTVCIVLHSLEDMKPGGKAREKPQPHSLADPVATAKTRPKGPGTENGCKLQDAVGAEVKGVYTAMN